MTPSITLGLASTLALASVAHAALPAVRASGQCPAPALVSEQLGAMLPASETDTFPDGAWLEIRELPADGGAAAALELRLAADGPARELARRVLPARGSCTERARALAVVAANWAAAYRTTGPPLPASESTQPADAASPSSAPLEAPASSPAPPTPPSAAPEPARAPVVTVRAASPAAPPRRDLAWSLGAGGGVVTAGRGSAAPLVTAELDLRRVGGAWPARLALSGAGVRTFALGDGEVAWRRATVALGLARRWGGATAFTSLGADALVGASSIEGRRFSVDETRTSLELGGEVSARAGARLGAVPLLMWAEAAAVGWAREQRVDVGGTAWSDALPRIDFVLTAGIAFDPQGR
ncbi:MAG TPA: hypothetical protein VK989_01415 [Polyangia bacterium]|nr:hypothetical protein [Polyangia bacterium]